MMGSLDLAKKRVVHAWHGAMVGFVPVAEAGVSSPKRTSQFPAPRQLCEMQSRNSVLANFLPRHFVVDNQWRAVEFFNLAAGGVVGGPVSGGGRRQTLVDSRLWSAGPIPGPVVGGGTLFQTLAGGPFDMERMV